jgi:hypothetical protein
MTKNPAPNPSTEQKDPATLTVRFPLPPAKRKPNGYLRRLTHLIPPRWRRRVVIQGQCFWLPG